MKPLDKIDHRILELLQADGRLANVELARRINLSPTPCLERVRRLERDGYISGYRAILDAEKLGRGFVTFMTLTLDQTTNDVLSRFGEEIRRLDEVVECQMVGGGFDYLLKIRTESMAAFRRFMGEKLSAIEGVSQTHSYFVMETVKEEQSIKVLA